VQGSNYLRQLSITPGSSSGSSANLSPGSGGAANSSETRAAGTGAPGAGGGSVVEVGRINMNATGDDHVSFSAVHLALSPCGRLLLVSADNGRLVIYERAGERVGRRAGGLTSQPATASAA